MEHKEPTALEMAISARERLQKDVEIFNKKVDDLIKSSDEVQKILFPEYKDWRIK